MDAHRRIELEIASAGLVIGIIVAFLFIRGVFWAIG